MKKFWLSAAAAGVLAAAMAPGAAAHDQRGATCIDPVCHSTALYEFDSSSGGGSGSATEARRYGAWGFDTAGMDRSVSPGDSFFRYANGTYLDNLEIPADRTRYGSFDLLRELSENRLKALVEEYAAAKPAATTDEGKIAALYNSFMDEARVEQLGAAPLRADLAEIRGLKTRRDVARYMGSTSGRFGGSFFGGYVTADAKAPTQNALYMFQAGLSLPDRDYYLKDSFKEQKAKYEAYVAQQLRNIGWENANQAAKDIVAMETRIAEVSWSRIESRDDDKTYNPMTIAELQRYAPGFDWNAWMQGADLASRTNRAIVAQNTAFPKIAQVFSETPIETLRAWQAFKLVDQASPMLSRQFADANFEFRNKTLAGQPQQRPRWKRAIQFTEGSIGEALGRAYVARYFPPESKAKMDKLVNDLRRALEVRINGLPWMSADTKAKALEKLAKFTVKIGYPTKWEDYSSLTVDAGDLYGNAQRAGMFAWRDNIEKLGKPVDREEWGMTPQTVNAYYNPTMNEIVFPAAILQPPFFDPDADPAVNYGGIGGVIGHEIGHGFDDQGRKSDGDGVLTDWWTAEDASKFMAQAARLGAQFDTYEPVPGAKVQGQLTMGENIGDLAGVTLALEAYRLSLNGQPAPVIDGFTGDQRVFLGWAQVWRGKYREAAMRQQVVSDPHAPPEFRVVGPLRNIDAWYEAFGVKEGDKYYVKPEDRVRIW